MNIGVNLKTDLNLKYDKKPSFKHGSVFREKIYLEKSKKKTKKKLDRKLKNEN